MHPTLAELLEQNVRHAEAFSSRFDDVQNAQHPDTVTVCCSDSRVLQDHIWGNDEPGEMFTCATIGNRVMQRTDAGTVVSGDVLYPITYTGTKTIIVVGHTGCGAVTAAYEDLSTGRSDPTGIEYCLELLKDHLETGVRKLPSNIDTDDAVNRLVEYNVDRQVAFLVDATDIPPDVDVVGVVYDFQDVYSGRRGEVHVINIDGENDVKELRASYPTIDARIDRLWEY